MIFDRLLQFNDITAITIIYNDDSKDYIYVDYKESGDYLGAPNVNQDTKLSELGNLYITISGKNRIIDIFPDEMINDKKSMEFHEKMIMPVTDEELEKTKKEIEKMNGRNKNHD